MNDAQFGEIPVEDYLKITGRRRFLLVRRLSLCVGGVLVCLLSMAAGDLYSPIYGDQRDLTYEDALELLQEAPPQKWLADAGMYGANHHVMELVEALKIAAKTSPENARYASVYLANIGEAVIRSLVDLRDSGVLPEFQEEKLRQLRSETDKDDD